MDIEVTEFKLTTDKEVFDIIKNMKSSSSSGVNEISSKILQRCIM